MRREDDGIAGFEATLAAMEALDDPRQALPLVGAALAEEGPVRRQALRFLLARPGIEAVVPVVRAFAGLDGEERSEALAERPRLLAAADAVLGDPLPEARLGLAALAAALRPAEALRLLVHLVDDPVEAVRRRAREGLQGTCREYLRASRVLPGPADLRRLVSAIEIVIPSSGPPEARILLESLVEAAGDAPEARAALRTLAVRGSEATRSALFQALAIAPARLAASVLLDLAGLHPPVEIAMTALRRRRDPEFLGELAREASRRMETPVGLPAAAGAALAHVAWESLPTTDLVELPALAGRRLLAIVRSFRGELPVRARRIAVFLRSRDRRTRELALDALADVPPSLFKEDLPALLEDPAEEIQLRAVELMARAGTPECRRRLAEKAPRSTDRIRRFILGRLSATRSPETVLIGAGSVHAPGTIQEYSFPVVSAHPALGDSRP